MYIKRLTEIISIHALREEGDCCAPTPAMSPCNFYPRPPRGGRPLKTEDYQKVIDISIHALREEGDGDPLQPVHRQRISIHALREEGDRKSLFAKCHINVISIHALREEGDVQRQYVHQEFRDFYPRPPRGGRRYKTVAFNWVKQFLSTPSARRATRCGFPPVTYRAFLSTPSARRATRTTAACSPRVSKFLSTPSARRATLCFRYCCTLFADFYPRPPRGGRPLQTAQKSVYCNFYPRPPRGGRPTSSSSRLACSGFLSTPSARRATCSFFFDG